MTTPDLSFVIPTKFKPWVGAVGALLTFIIPTLTEVAAELPQPWPAVFAAALAGLTWLGIYKVPYAPTGTVLVPDTAAVREAVVPLPHTDINDTPPPTPGLGGYHNPWK